MLWYEWIATMLNIIITASSTFGLVFLFLCH
jgi:hypothetical protein